MKMIYHYADQQWISIASFDLYLKLRRKTQREKKMCLSKVLQSLPNCLSIDQRPEAANQCTEPGHMEIG
jgi:IS30 family transposase